MVALNQRPTLELADLHAALARLAAVAQQSAEPQSSVQIEQAAKPGCPPRITVKVYAASPVLAAEEAQHLYDALVARYAAEASA
jgi:hypothetical protein